MIRGIGVGTGGLGVFAGWSAVAAFRRGNLGGGLLLASASGWCLLASLILWEER